jgi:hypothetical protein
MSNNQKQVLIDLIKTELKKEIARLITAKEVIKNK